MWQMQTNHTNSNGPGSEDELRLEEESADNNWASKVRKLSTELCDAKQLAADHLQGWQRAKADLINYRRTVEAERANDKMRATYEVLQDIIPVLDSFDGAMTHEEWKNTDETWRTGVEQIAAQLHRVLEERGVELFGIVGETFDPRLHECVGVAAAHASGSADTVATVLQKGYKSGDIVLRPAKVVVAQAVHEDTT